MIELFLYIFLILRTPDMSALPQVEYHWYRRLGGLQNRFGRVRKISPPPGFDPRKYLREFSFFI
jgi:hypothetical protein